MYRQFPSVGARACPGKPGRHRSAFSLLELLISVALILVMFVLLWGRGSRSRQHQLKTQCAENLQHIMVAVATHALEHTNAFPVWAGAKSAEEPLSTLVPRYTTTTARFICPGSREAKLPEAESFSQRRISYAYYMGQTSEAGPDQPIVSDAQINTAPKKRGEPLFSADGRGLGSNHDRHGGNVLFADGHSATSPAAAAFDLLPSAKVVLLNPRR